MSDDSVTTDKSPPSGNITFSVESGVVLTIKSDGSIVKGDGLSDDEASLAFFECLSRGVPCWIKALRDRAETAEQALLGK